MYVELGSFALIRPSEKKALLHELAGSVCTSFKHASTTHVFKPLFNVKLGIILFYSFLINYIKLTNFEATQMTCRKFRTSCVNDFSLCPGIHSHSDMRAQAQAMPSIYF